MNLLVLKKFNNYFNRKIIKYDSLDDYEDHSDSFTYLNDINFNPNDGVRTELVLGKGQLGAFFDFEKTDSPDYLVAYTTEVLHNPDEEDTYIHTIESRWFVTEAKRTRGGQYALQLKRDSISDNLNTLINCPAFIRKGTVRDDNPLVVNDEGVKVNQIKSSETLLKDGTNSAWIVGYLSKNFNHLPDEEEEQDISFQAPAGDYDYITIEDLADELHVSASDLASILVTEKNNQARFVNDNIEFVGWLNFVDQSDLEYRFIARSTDLLGSFSKAISDVKHHARTSDCFCYGGGLECGFATGVTGKPIWLAAWNNHINEVKSKWNSYVGHPLLGKNVYDKLVELQKNHILIRKAGLYYQVVVGDGAVNNTGETYSVGATSLPFATICSEYITNVNAAAASDPQVGEITSTGHGTIFVNYNELVANVYLTSKLIDPSVPKVGTTISTSRNGVLDQPFDMFAIPFNDTTIIDGVNVYDVVGDYAQKLAIALMAQETAGQIYDIQLLPYCPMLDVVGTNAINLTGKTEHADYDWVTYTGSYIADGSASVAPIVNEYALQEYEAVATYQSTINDSDLVEWGWSAINQETEPRAQQAFDDWIEHISVSKTVVGGKSKFTIYNQVQDPQSFEYADVIVTFWFTYNTSGTLKKSVIIYPKTNSFSTDLGYNLTLKESMKIDSQTDLYRLVSPNYQGSFDFNVAKNGGSVNGFIADCTYKPYTPYIKVAPNFAWLYGTNYGDARGLICGGDFSIGFYSDRWQEFQLQNKNYQNIFNREIQNLDVNQSIQRTQQYVSGGIGIVNSAAQGAVTGAIASGSPWGALAGGIVGGVASGVGYGVDNSLMEKGLIEQRQFAIDKFNMQLNNIQALPYTLTKVGAFNINSKIWPFLEYYTCSDVEKDALKMKIQYEGMTIGIVDTLSNYMFDGYLQADLIRNDYIVDDPHQLEDIYLELTKGVYM